MRILLWLFALVGVARCAGRMPLVGIDGKGKITEAFVDEARYERNLERALGESSQGMLQVLEKQHPRGHWRLRTAQLGFAVSAEAGIGPFKAGIRPGIRAAFSTGTNPPIP
jgi:hypothetical protein